MSKMKMALASDGKSYPVEEVVRNKGSVGRVRIVFVGASYRFCHKVARDLLLVGGFDDCELVLLDIAAEPLKLVGDLMEKMIRQAGSRMTVVRTMDRRTAFRGARIVLLSITVGGMEADMRAAEVCAAHGISVTVGDTMGPAALARNLRTLPVVLALARDMEKHCPQAVMLNLTNPMSCITGTVNRFSAVRAMGLCHSAEDLLVYFAKVYGCSPRDFRVKLGGVNHQSFMTSLMLRGKERIGTLLDDAAESDASLEDSLLDRKEEMGIQWDLYRTLGVFPSTGGEHAAEFYRYFITRKYIREAGLHVKRIARNRKPVGPSRPNPLLAKWAYGPGPVEDMDLLTTEHVHELVWTVLTGKPSTRVLNILNQGFIAGLPATACVEVAVKVTREGCEGTELTLPTAVTALLQQWTAVHELSIQAALHANREAARQALFLDPHVADVSTIDPILDGFIDRLGRWLPRWGHDTRRAQWSGVIAGRSVRGTT